MDGRQRYGRLVVIGMAKKRGDGKVVVLCDCGRKKHVRMSDLQSDTRSRVRSCGCIFKWTVNKAQRRLAAAIQYEINEFHRYRRTEEDWDAVFGWLENEAKQFNSCRSIDEEHVVVRACAKLK